MRCWTWALPKIWKRFLQPFLEKRQTALFSATLPPKIAKIAENHLHDAFHILIPKEKVPEGEQPKVSSPLTSSDVITKRSIGTNFGH